MRANIKPTVEGKKRSREAYSHHHLVFKCSRITLVAGAKKSCVFAAPCALKASQRARRSPEGAVRGTDAQEAPRTATGASLFIRQLGTTSCFIPQAAFTYLIDSDMMFC